MPEQGMSRRSDKYPPERFVIERCKAAEVKVSDLVVSGDGVTRVTEIAPTVSRKGAGVDLLLVNGEEPNYLATDLVWRARES